MIKISKKSFILGLGIGIILVSGINLIINNTYSIDDINSSKLEKNKKEEFILLIDSNTNENEVFQKLTENGIELKIETFKNKLENKEFKRGLYRLNVGDNIDYIISNITNIVE